MNSYTNLYNIQYTIRIPTLSDGISDNNDVYSAVVKSLGIEYYHLQYVISNLITYESKVQ